MTARKILRRVLLAALLCVLLASAALAAETPTVDSIETAQDKLKTAVEKQEESFVVSLPSDDYLASYTTALRNHILEHADWVDVSPRITVEPNTGIMQDTAIIVRLRYAENHGEYKDALDAAAAACVRSGMSDAEKAASIYSWLADTIVPTEQCDTAYEALVDRKADCFGFAAAFRAIAREAGLECTLVRGKYSSSEHAWNAVKIGKSDDGTGGVWYYVDASRGDGPWIPGRVDYQYLLFGTSKSGYSAAVSDISTAEYPLVFSRSGVCTPLALRDDGFWFIQGNLLKSAPYGADFKDAGTKVLGHISAAPFNVLWAAVMADDVIYYSMNIPGDTALYSYTPGMPEAEARETGLSDKFGLRLDGRTLRLVQDGQTVQSAKLRRYSGFAGTAWFGYDADAALPALTEANIRLLGQADGATVFAGFYDAAGRMLSAQVLGSADAISPKAAPGGCTQARFFAVDAGLRPIAEPLTISGS